MAGVTVGFAGVGRAGSPLAALDLALAGGEVVALLGPAGAGKTLALRLLAGLERPGHGRLSLDGQDMHGIPPHRRALALVPPPAGLPPGEPVAALVGAGLPVREAPGRVARALTLLGLDGQERRPVGALPPAGRVRVALAMALAREEPVLLLDDPLDGLDPATRAGFAFELRALLRRAGRTTLLALRDGREAMALADRIAVLEEGRISQAGPPRTLYDRPESALVASLLGENNRLPGTVEWLEGGDCGVRLDCGPLVEARAADAAGPGSRCIVTVRPERVAVAAMSAEEMGEGALPAAVRDAVFLGDHVRLVLELGRGGVLVARRPPAGRLPSPGGVASVAWDAGVALAFRAFR